MINNTEPCAAASTVIWEPGALTFTTRKEWRPVPESQLCELEQMETEKVFKGTSSIYFLLRQIGPLENYKANQFKVVRVSMDEEGKTSFAAMDLTISEADQLCKNIIALWD